MSDLAITLDVDWAPDFVIDDVAERLAARDVRATWFLTHMSPAIERLAAHGDLFELGIHPNFLPGSTHGNDHDTVLRHCMTLAPEARSMRTHGLYHSTPLMERIAVLTPIEFDVSIYMPRHVNLGPVDFWGAGRRIIRFPYLWEDDFEMQRPDPLWDVEALPARGDGLTILDFHPIHVYLNSSSMDSYERLKQREPNLAQARESSFSDLVQDGAGTGAFFDALLNEAGEAVRICDLATPASVGSTVV